MAKLGIRLDATSSATLKDTLQAIAANPQLPRETFEAIQMMVTKPMQNALYFCTNDYQAS